jgi:hypothetical protein
MRTGSRDRSARSNRPDGARVRVVALLPNQLQTAEATAVQSEPTQDHQEAQHVWLFCNELAAFDGVLCCHACAAPRRRTTCCQDVAARQTPSRCGLAFGSARTYGATPCDSGALMSKWQRRTRLRTDVVPAGGKRDCDDRLAVPSPAAVSGHRARSCHPCVARQPRQRAPRAASGSHIRTRCRTSS